MVSLPVDIAELCVPNMITVNVNWGLQQNSEQASSSLLLLSLLCYCKETYKSDSEGNLFITWNLLQIVLQ